MEKIIRIRIEIENAGSGIYKIPETEYPQFKRYIQNHYKNRTTKIIKTGLTLYPDDFRPWAW